MAALPAGSTRTVSEQGGLSIPVSLGPATAGTDNGGKSCTVFDIVVHPELIEHAQQNASGKARAFLCIFCLQHVEKAHDKLLDYQYKLPRLVYKGDAGRIPCQFIRRKVNEEVHGSSASAVPAPAPASLARVPVLCRPLRLLLLPVLCRALRLPLPVLPVPVPVPVLRFWTACAR